eukprot:TRINITY_DN15641_c0_g1_i1.p1 TRINITY_DN15641_c0_g1~~TRINITY_DN15641_c0_g1_i1.p1  ORF type:complete len:1234 (+),score=321.17 TRINITY_DN15641_c0_g1_i1:35-3703(+)
MSQPKRKRDDIGDPLYVDHAIGHSYVGHDLKKLSLLERLRVHAELPLPSLFVKADHFFEVVPIGGPTKAAGDEAQIAKHFPCTYGQPMVELRATTSVPPKKILNIGVVLSGGQASGGHNVIAGIYDFMQRLGAPGSKLYGFLDGPAGIFKHRYRELDGDYIKPYRNQGGFDMIGSGRDKIETEQQFASSAAICEQLHLNGLVVIGGDDSNTNAALLAEYFKARKSATAVIGVPKTIDGDLKNELIETSFGFDTACKLYSELIGNVMIDANASQKYYHFVRLMGRAASHIALECALQTHPNVCLIGEEMSAHNITLSQIQKSLCDTIVERSRRHKDFGVVLVPEGLIEFIPEVSALINELNNLLAKGHKADETIANQLTFNSSALFHFLPVDIRAQLLLERDPHGNVQVSKIETEALLIYLCEHELRARHERGEYNGVFSTQTHFFGYEGRCPPPSVFDATYCYSLGFAAGALVDVGCTGYMSCVRNLAQSQDHWSIGGAPITSFMNIELRKGKPNPVIRKALVELNGLPFVTFAQLRDAWRIDDHYRNPGPIQYEGPSRHSITFTLQSTTNCDLVAQVQPQSSDAPVTQEVQRFDDQPAFVTYKSRADFSSVQWERLSYVPKLPAVLQSPFQVVDGDAAGYEMLDPTQLQAFYPNLFAQPLAEILPTRATFEFLQSPSISKTRPLRVGVVFNGRQCPGGHNVVYGIFDMLHRHRNGSTLIGFLGGSLGMFAGHHTVITERLLSMYRNQGGFDLLGRSVDRIRGEKDYRATAAVCQKLRLDGLVIVGGHYSMSDAARVAEYFLANSVPTRVIGVPGTVDGDLKGPFIEMPFGFDTASKVYSQLIGNIAIDCNSNKKYWYFIRLMGRAPSWVTLECALQTHPNVVLIGEEIAAKKRTLTDITRYIADAICLRASHDKNYGILLIPEGLVAMIPEVGLLIDELNSIFHRKEAMTAETVIELFTPWSRALFQTLPPSIQKQLLIERESHGSVQLSQIHTEKLLEDLVAAELKRRKTAGQYKGAFACIGHYIGYQGRSALPSEFDCNLAYTLGFTAAVLLAEGRTGHMASARGLTSAVENWTVGGIPFTALMTAAVTTDDNDTAVLMSPVAGSANGPSIDAKHVDLGGKAFARLCANRARWLEGDDYHNPGPVQFTGKAASLINLTLVEEQNDMMQRLMTVFEQLRDIKRVCRVGYSDDVLDAALVGLSSLSQILDKLAKRNRLAPM